MSDIATLGISVDATPVTQGSAALDKFTASAGQAQASANKLGAEIGRQNAAMSQTTSATQANAAALDRNSTAYRDLDAELEKFLAANNKVYAAQRNLSSGQDLLDQGVKAGLISQQTATQTLENLTKKYAPAAEGAVKLASAHAATTVSAGFLTREMRALGDELASGRTRQAEGTFALLATRLAGLGPVGIAAAAGIAAVGVAVGVFVGRREEMDRAIASVETGFTATGNASLVSSGQIRKYIDALALAPGVSREAADKSVAELSRIPGITGPVFDRSIAIVRDFSAVLGVDVPEGAKRLASSLADPKAGAESLDKQFNLLTGTQRTLIDDFVRHGDKASALNIILQAIEDRAKGVANNALTPMQRSIKDVTDAWDRLGRSFGDDSGLSTATRAVIFLIDKTAQFVDLVTSTRGAVKDFYVGAYKSVTSIADQSEIGTADGDTSLARALAGNSKTAPTATRAIPVADNASIGGVAAAVAASNTQASATRATTKAIEDQSKAVYDIGKLYSSQAKITQGYIDDQTRLKAALASGTLDATQTKSAKDTLVAIQERMAKRSSGPEPLTLGLDKAQSDSQIKAIDFIYEKEKQSLDATAALNNFYHEAGVRDDKQFYGVKLSLVDQFSTAELKKLDDQIAVKKKLDETYAAATPATGAQGLEVAKAREVNQQSIDDLVNKEFLLRAKMASDKSLLVLEEQRAERVTATNVAMAKTQEITSKLAEQEELFDVQVKLGRVTQLEATNAKTAVTKQAIAALQTQIAAFEQLRASDIAANDTAAAEKQLTVINKLQTEVLKLSADLDPIGQKLNGIVNSGLTSFLDKIGNGGIKSFKDLKTAALDALGDVAKQITHVTNQAASDDILKYLGGQANSATGGTGGVGGALANLLGLGSGGGGNGAAASVTALGTAAQNAALALNQISGNSVVNSATSSGGNSGGILSSIFGKVGSLFGSGSSNSNTAGALNNAQAASVGTFESQGITVTGLHTGGIIGSSATFHRSVDMSMFEGARRYHTGGVLGDNEEAIIGERGEGVFTPAQMAKMAPVSNQRAGDTIRVNQTFVVNEPKSRQSQAQMMSNAARALKAASRRRSA